MKELTWEEVRDELITDFCNDRCKKYMSDYHCPDHNCVAYLTLNFCTELNIENFELKSEVKAGAGMLADMHDESASQAKEHERERITGIIANASYSRPDSLDLILPFKTWQELCRTDGQFLNDSK